MTTEKTKAKRASFDQKIDMVLEDNRILREKICLLEDELSQAHIRKNILVEALKELVEIIDHEDVRAAIDSLTIRVACEALKKVIDLNIIGLSPIEPAKTQVKASFLPSRRQLKKKGLRLSS